MRMEPLVFDEIIKSVGLEFKRSPASGKHLNQAWIWSWPERQERSGSLTEALRLAMPKKHSRRDGALIVARS